MLLKNTKQVTHQITLFHNKLTSRTNVSTVAKQTINSWPKISEPGKKKCLNERHDLNVYISILYNEVTIKHSYII